MKLIIFGATGSVGTPLLQQALEQGYTVTAFTRNPQKLSAISHEKLSIIQGDILNLRDVNTAVSGQDAVLCVIGDGNKGTVRSEGTRNIIAAMKDNGVKRLVCETTLGLGDSRGNLNLMWKIIFGVFLRKAFKDHEMQERHIFGSRLNYTIVRPSAFTDGEKTGAYKVGFDSKAKGLSLKIARKDVAHFMLKQVATDSYMNRAVSISN
jgi:putative NADH-flavin reductase